MKLRVTARLSRKSQLEHSQSCECIDCNPTVKKLKADGWVVDYAWNDLELWSKAPFFWYFPCQEMLDAAERNWKYSWSPFWYGTSHEDKEKVDIYCTKYDEYSGNVFTNLPITLSLDEFIERSVNIRQKMLKALKVLSKGVPLRAKFKKISGKSEKAPCQGRTLAEVAKIFRDKGWDVIDNGDYLILYSSHRADEYGTGGHTSITVWEDGWDEDGINRAPGKIKLDYLGWVCDDLPTYGVFINKLKKLLQQPYVPFTGAMIISLDKLIEKADFALDLLKKADFVYEHYWKDDADEA